MTAMTEPTEATEATQQARRPVLSIDESTDFGARAARHLREDPVIWLTTVGLSGAPSPNPVWFLWDGAATVVLFSLPDAARVAHLSANQRVCLHFGDGRGGDIVVFSGIGAVQPEAPGADAVPEYLAKYAQHLTRIGLTPQTFADRYSVPVIITLTRLRGH
jgi:PPOX class probable F420-dependent enzyme